MPRGRFVVVTGVSGSGKSTLLHILGSLESVTDGQTTFRDEIYTLREPDKGSRFGEWFGRGRVLLWLIALLGLSILGAILLAAALAGPLFARSEDVTVVGYISDSMCGLSHSDMQAKHGGAALFSEKACADEGSGLCFQKDTCRSSQVLCSR